MSDGWYKGRIGLNNSPYKEGKVFGDEYKLCLYLIVYFKD